ncbi:MAG: bacteriorhodopsin [Candidatus Hermodarchaeia archaeon]|jgi:sensory rhodopsin
MAGEELLVFWIMAAIFGIATVMFSLLSIRSGTNEFLSFVDIIVAFVTTISYVLMALGFLTVTSIFGEPIYWSRWLFYMASCSLLTVSVAVVLRNTQPVILAKIPILTMLVMFCGFLAAFITGIERWWFFAFSSIAYIALLITLFKGVPRDGMNSQLMWFIIIFWSLFPLVFLLAPTGFGLITTFIAAIIYAALDVITKLIYGLIILFRVKTA